MAQGCISLSALARHAVRAAAVLAITLAATIALVRLAPGFGLDERIADSTLGAETRAAIEQERAAQGFWQTAFGGKSAAYEMPVAELFARRWRGTAVSVAGGWLLAWVLAMTAVMLRYVAGPFETRFNLLDWLTRAPNVASLALLSTPAALLGLLAFLYRLPVAVAIAAAVFPVIFRFLNSRFATSGISWAALAAEARGAARWRVAAWHILYPERGELAMLAAVSFKWALSAAIPAEVFAGQAGLGELVWKAAEARDLALVLPLTLTMAALVQAAQFLAGLAHRAGRAEAAAV